MIRTLTPVLAIAALLTLVACGKEKPKPGTTGGTPTPPAQPEAPITKENMNSELDKLDAEISAQ